MSSKYIYDLPLPEWALKFTHDADIDNELNEHHLTMRAIRRQINQVDGRIIAYQISTSHLKRRYLTLHVLVTIKGQRYVTRFRLYSPFVPAKLKKLDDLVGCHVESIFPVCFIRHRRYEGTIAVLSSIRIKTDNGIIILRTVDEIDESRCVQTSSQSLGKVTGHYAKYPRLTEQDVIDGWYSKDDTSGIVIDPSVTKK